MTLPEELQQAEYALHIVKSLIEVSEKTGKDLSEDNMSFRQKLLKKVIDISPKDAKGHIQEYANFMDAYKLLKI